MNVEYLLEEIEQAITALEGLKKYKNFEEKGKEIGNQLKELAGAIQEHSTFLSLADRRGFVTHTPPTPPLPNPPESSGTETYFPK